MATRVGDNQMTELIKNNHGMSWPAFALLVGLSALGGAGSAAGFGLIF